MTEATESNTNQKKPNNTPNVIAGKLVAKTLNSSDAEVFLDLDDSIKTDRLTRLVAPESDTKKVAAFVEDNINDDDAKKFNALKKDEKQKRLPRLANHPLKDFFFTAHPYYIGLLILSHVASSAFSNQRASAQRSTISVVQQKDAIDKLKKTHKTALEAAKKSAKEDGLKEGVKKGKASVSRFDTAKEPLIHHILNSNTGSYNDKIYVPAPLFVAENKARCEAILKELGEHTKNNLGLSEFTVFADTQSPYNDGRTIKVNDETLAQSEASREQIIKTTKRIPSMANSFYNDMKTPRVTYEFNTRSDLGTQPPTAMLEVKRVIPDTPDVVLDLSPLALEPITP